MLWCFGASCFAFCRCHGNPPALPKPEEEGGENFFTADKQVFPVGPQLSEKSAPLVIQKEEPHPGHSPPARGQKLPGFNEQGQLRCPMKLYVIVVNFHYSVLSCTAAIRHNVAIEPRKMGLVHPGMRSSCKNVRRFRSSVNQRM